MRSLMNHKELPARIRFLLQDTVELRENNWVPRKAFIDNGPKTINQIRQDAVKVSRRRLRFFVQITHVLDRCRLETNLDPNI